MEIKRDAYLRKLIDRQHNGLVKVITGIRRCGNVIYLNKLDVICTSGPQKDGEFDDEDIFGE